MQYSGITLALSKACILDMDRPLDWAMRGIDQCV